MAAGHAAESLFVRSPALAKLRDGGNRRTHVRCHGQSTHFWPAAAGAWSAPIRRENGFLMPISLLYHAARGNPRRSGRSRCLPSVPSGRALEQLLQDRFRCLFLEIGEPRWCDLFLPRNLGHCNDGPVSVRRDPKQS